MRKTENQAVKTLFYLFIFPSLRTSIFIALFIANCSFLIGIDFSIRPKGFASFPMRAGNTSVEGFERYSVGGGGELGFEVDLAAKVLPTPMGLGFTLGLEGAMLINPLQSSNPSPASFYSGAGVLGIYIFPLSRFFFRIDGALGVNGFSYEERKSNPGLYWRGGTELGFRFTPSFIIAANVGWRHYTYGFDFADNGFESSRFVNSGIYTGITMQLSFQTNRGKGRDRIEVSLVQDTSLYPVFMQLYQTNPIGSVHIRNNENAELRNVRMSFRSDGYTASEFPCGSVPIIPRGGSSELPLFADFSPEILRFTDSSRILGELVIRYRFLGKERETVKVVTLASYNRNMVTFGGAAGDDASEFAAFISPTSPETLDFARFIAGLSRANSRIGHNRNMQYSIWLLEGLRASNIRFGKTYSSSKEVQFPAETLAYHTGTSRDLALLFAAALEGVGISSAFIYFRETENSAGDFLVAVNLGIGQSAAETLFNGTEKILIINDEVWLPLSMTAFNRGFMAVWNKGAEILDQIFTKGLEADFVMVKEAWASYPPAPLPELEGSPLRTDTEAAINQANLALQAYIIQEIYPLIFMAQSTGDNTAADYNRLGILFARAGLINDGKINYENAAKLGSVPAMSNRGNLALIEQDYTAAEHWFRQMLQHEPANKAALRGLERIEGSR